MSAPVVAIFCMPERGHLHRLLPLVAGFARRGVDTHVFTDAAYREPVERAGGRLVDLFHRYSLEDADATSRPIPSRYVTFAAHYAAPLLDEVARLAPTVIVYDTFAVIGRLLGRQLGVPYVNVCTGHAMTPARAVAALEGDPRVATSDACRRAVEALRDRWGLSDASPFAYFTGVSPFLNVYSEPPEFLPPEDRAAFEPIVFLGSLSLPEIGVHDVGHGEPPFGLDDADGLRVYVSFGTVVWRYYESVALEALGTVSAALSALGRARTLISLGGHPLPATLRGALVRRNVHVADYVDQHRVLRDASLFITHHGLNSTHEAIYHRVPMLSYPFSAPQQHLAARCQELGLALPLVGAPRARVSEGAVLAALGRLEAQATGLKARLTQARTWETKVMDGRDAVIQRILDLGKKVPAVNGPIPHA